ncbi:hypothetical protein ACFQ0G_32740 [Streptomyces chiangmaiensis]
MGVMERLLVRGSGATTLQRDATEATLTGLRANREAAARADELREGFTAPMGRRSPSSSTSTDGAPAPGTDTAWTRPTRRTTCGGSACSSARRRLRPCRRTATGSAGSPPNSPGRAAR